MKELERPAIASGMTSISVAHSEVAGAIRYAFPQQPSLPQNSIADTDSSRPQLMSTDLSTATEAASIQNIDIQLLMEACCRNRPSISLNPHVLGGVPHIRGTRLSVGQLVGRVRALGSIESVVEYYKESISESQIKEALAYVQEFIERACDPYQTFD
jgi:uncharacterized protein (DUF433 family)